MIELENAIEIRNCPKHGITDSTHRCPHFDSLVVTGWMIPEDWRNDDWPDLIDA